MEEKMAATHEHEAKLPILNRPILVLKALKIKSKSIGSCIKHPITSKHINKGAAITGNTSLFAKYLTHSNIAIEDRSLPPP